MAGATEQIEISSCYLKSGFVGFATVTPTTSNVGSLFLGGSLRANRFYSTSDASNLTTSSGSSECKRLEMPNNPIILKANQSLYMALESPQFMSAKGGCTVFGLKRTI
jgi:hypothetical protein